LLRRIVTASAVDRNEESLMQTRRLGQLEVSALGLGCMGLSFGYGPAWDRKESIKLLRTAVELGIGFVPFGPLGKGFLTGKVDDGTQFAAGDFRTILPRFTPQARKANRALVDVLAKLAARLNTTPAAWPWKARAIPSRSRS
jgi:aryl-alcohol dehydrogenase-like predicted oxidoreductase